MIRTAARSPNSSPIHPEQVPPRVPSPEDPLARRTEEISSCGDDTQEQVEVQRLRAALEDVVSLAGSSGDAMGKVIQMKRRALAGLSGWNA